MKKLFQSIALIATVGLGLGIGWLCIADVFPRPENRIVSLADQVDRTWGEIEDLRADMRELEERVAAARTESYRAGRAFIRKAAKELEEIPKGQGGACAPPAPENKKTSKQRM